MTHNNPHRNVKPIKFWKVIEPGVIELPTTGYQIRHNKEEGEFILSWHGKVLYSHLPSLSAAKRTVEQHMRDMLEMGYET